MNTKLQGKTLSILGDSVSTYEGISNDKHRQFTLVSNPSYYAFPFPLEGTYWRRLTKRYGLRLCVNNAWSGAFLTRHFPGMGVDREKTLSPGVERVAYLADNEGNTPDIILVFMGLNDLGCGVEIDAFASAYEQVTRRIKTLYPNAVTFCVGMPNRDEALYARTVAYNRAIERAVALGGERFAYVDLFSSSLQGEEYIQKSVDGLHPDEKGMESIAEVIGNAVEKYFDERKEE